MTRSGRFPKRAAAQGLLLLSLLFSNAPLGAQEAKQAPAPKSDPSTPAFKKAVALQASGHYKSARKAFLRIQKKYPNSIHQQEIAWRSGENAYLGVHLLHQGGPPARRINVTVMGDGFTLAAKDQQLEARWSKLCLKVLWSEKVYSVYRNYFNFYFVRLASKEARVDPKLTAAQRKKIVRRNQNRAKKKKTEYSTALDAKEAGPQKQVMMDRRLVYKWLRIAARDMPGCAQDRLVIAFARFGRLGMGGGGIANVGRPDRSVTVHEFGHAFVGLLDEYTGNPRPPRRPIMAANAATTNDPKQVPWAHFLAAKVPGVGVFEGGATYTHGVWRPARGCAMNSAGHTSYCPVCREAALLRVYSHVSPLDGFTPPAKEPLVVRQGSKLLLKATPMQPLDHKLQVAWFVQSAPTLPAAADDDGGEVPASLGGYERRPPRLFGLGTLGRRGRQDRSAYKAAPPGRKSPLGRFLRGPHPVAVFPPGRLEPGRYLITVKVWDPSPWVLKDPQHLLEERVSWTVTIQPRARP